MNSTIYKFPVQLLQELDTISGCDYNWVLSEDLLDFLLDDCSGNYNVHRDINGYTCHELWLYDLEDALEYEELFMQA